MSDREILFNQYEARLERLETILESIPRTMSALGVDSVSVPVAGTPSTKVQKEGDGDTGAAGTFKRSRPPARSANKLPRVESVTRE